MAGVGVSFLIWQSAARGPRLTGTHRSTATVSRENVTIFIAKKKTLFKYTRQSAHVICEDVMDVDSIVANSTNYPNPTPYKNSSITCKR